MMQRKNRPKVSGSGSETGYGSGYDSSNNDNNNVDAQKPSPNKPPAPPRSGNGIGIGALTGHPPPTPPSNGGRIKPRTVVVATVKRRRCGTQPFDKHWLNLDCCGLVCVGLTYLLHLYGAYAFGWVLLPPWFSVMDEDGYRELSFGCHFHRTLFVAIAVLAVFSHFKAMTTDPGAVPPDATPLPDLDELDCFVKGESSPRSSPHRSNSWGAGSNEGVSTNSTERATGPDAPMSVEKGNVLDSPSRHVVTHQLAGTTAGVTVGYVATAVAGAAAGAGLAAAVGVAATASAVAGRGRPTANIPGAPPRGKRMCRRCQAFKPPRAHHCSICNRCVTKMDHHCPWVNNCVGIGNHKYFLLFIFYTSLSCGYSLVFVLYRFFHCIGNTHRHGPRCIDHPADVLPLTGLAVEALLFGLFTLCMMVDQFDVVHSNVTHIDRLKEAREGGARTPLPAYYDPQDPRHHRAGINEVFGSAAGAISASTFHYTWLSPLHSVCFPDAIRDDILGYCRPAFSCAPRCAPGCRRKSQSMELMGRGNGVKGRAGMGDVADIV